MNWLQDRRLLLTVGGGVVVLLASLGAAFVIIRRDQAPSRPPPASVGGLVVQMGAPQDAKLDPTQPLRCFVGGQFVGLETLDQCAQKNGVATNSLDVGVDPNGALAAAGQGDGQASPASDAGAQDQSAAAAQLQAPAALAASRGPVGDCLRYGGAGWRKAGDNLTLAACVQTLFAGVCERPGAAAYGRWMGQTLRLEPHRVEASADNVNFHFLAAQSDPGCAIADF
ncbi:MAG: hypothetical protein JO303_08525 [Caulobacteraceae bacterium]|nr:hypothetical protein [Caulobacteraceae bacterium]